jgi:hypothetical protein
MTIQANIIKTSEVTFRFIESRGGTVGPDVDNLYDAFSQERISDNSFHLEFNETFTLNPATALYTGDIKVNIGSEFINKGGRFFYRQSDPLPVQIGAIYPDFDIAGSPE